MNDERKPTITKIQITSNNICYGPCSQPEDEIEQKLSIAKDGQVSIFRYAYGDGENKLISHERLSIGRDKADIIFDAIIRCFYQDYEEVTATDVGSWEMTVSNDNGGTDTFFGPLVETDHNYVEDENISDIIRESIGRNGLFVFDGNPDRIKRVEVVYNRVTKIKPGKKPKDAKWDFVTWDYKDTVVIDRKSERLEIRNRIGEGCIVTHTYYVQDGVENLLDNIHLEMLDDVKGNPSDVITDPMETRTYTIKILTKHGIERSISGTYDKDGLPSAWPEFMETLWDFIKFYGFPGEMFSERCFGKVLRREGEIIFCDVSFEEGGKTYCYIADTDEFCVGDLVVVPAGADNHKTVVTIEAINYYTEDKAPFPVDKAKHIIGKFDPDEIELDDIDSAKDDKTDPYQSDKEEVPEGYYDEIENPWEKKDFLIEHFSKLDPEIHTCKDKDYDYLEEDAYAVMVKNPECDRNMEIEMAGEFTLYFANWHFHYPAYEYDFSEMIKEADRIIKNELCAVVVEVNGNWTSSSLREASEIISKEKLIEDYERDHEDSMAARKGVAHVRFWDSNRDYDIVLND